MKTLRSFCLLAAALTFAVAPFVPAPAHAAESTFANPSLAPLAEKGFVVVTGTSTVTADFRAVIPLASTVIDTITFPTRLAAAGNYSGDTAIQGKTLAANIRYPIFGKSIKLASGSCIIILR